MAKMAHAITWMMCCVMVFLPVVYSIDYQCPYFVEENLGAERLYIE